MRKGLNPQKDKIEGEIQQYHQVVVPIYIPNEEGFFEHSFEVLKLSLESLFRTSHKQTYFTIVNNGSHDGIVKYLNTLLELEQIHELIHTHNIGKVNAVFKGVSGHQFPLVTVTDADVLFKDGWQKSTYDVFEEFPKTGFVTPTPNAKLLKFGTFDTIMYYWFSSKMSFKKPLNKDALKSFADSIENPEFYNEAHLNNILTLTGKKTNAVVGGGHFVATFRGTVFKNIKERYSKYKLGGKSVREFLDAPVIKKGYWRLSTQDNLAFHMGNIAEPWMREALQQLPESNDSEISLPKLTDIKRNWLLYKMKRVFFERILTKKLFWNRFLRRKGLSRGEANQY
ncbi:MAG: glycosyltransferase family A protein [Bacteroidota bacterium]